MAAADDEEALLDDDDEDDVDDEDDDEEDEDDVDVGDEYVDEEDEVRVYDAADEVDEVVGLGLGLYDDVVVCESESSSSLLSLDEEPPRDHDIEKMPASGEANWLKTAGEKSSWPYEHEGHESVICALTVLPLAVTVIHL